MIVPPVLWPGGKRAAAIQVCRTMCGGKPGFRKQARQIECKMSGDVHSQYHASEILCFTLPALVLPICGTCREPLAGASPG